MPLRLLDPLRGVAALWVFLHHLAVPPEFGEQYPLLAFLKRVGYLGVPMFFVISGYCLTDAARRSAGRAESPWRFLYRRWKRIYPPFWASVALVVGLPYLTAAVAAVRSGAFDPPAAPWLALDFMGWVRHLTLTQVFVPTGEMPWDKFSALNGVYWTLAVEVQFYAVVSLALFAGRHFGAVLAAVTALSVPFYLSPASYETGLFLSHWPLFALGAGVNAALANGTTPERLFGRRAWAWCLVTLAALGAVLLAQMKWFPPRAGELVRPFPPPFAAYFAAAVWLLAGLERAWGGVEWPAALRPAFRLPVLAGAMSYSIYLAHTQFQALALELLRPTPLPPLALAAAVLGLTCVLCYPFYRYVERPFAGVRQSPG